MANRLVNGATPGQVAGDLKQEHGWSREAAMAVVCDAQQTMKTEGSHILEDLDAEKEGKSGKSGLMRIGAAVLGILGGIINLFAPMLGLSEGVDPFMTPEFVFLMILALMAITGGILSLTKNLMVGTALRVLGGPGAFAFFLAAVTFTPGWGDNAAIVIVGFIFTVPAALLALGATLWNAF